LFRRFQETPSRRARLSTIRSITNGGRGDTLSTGLFIKPTWLMLYFLNCV